MTRFVAVIDIGKTNAKVALVDLETSREIAVFKTPNHVTAGPPYPHFDIRTRWAFILSGLKSLSQKHSVDAISVTTHGATAALVDAKGNLVLPVLDYEFAGPNEKRAAYEAVRPHFDETGSPSLPIGLNLGAQIFWLAQSFPNEFARCAAILTYPQYWSYRMSGVMASEATSLGCHTDLWNPWTGDFSSLVSSQGWRHLFPKVQLANANLGPVLDEIADSTGIKRGTPVYCGIHDSNASLLPYLGGGEGSFAVVSTGTWIIAMAVGGKKVLLDPARDTLVNVNAYGKATPTARFMGGRDFETMVGTSQVAARAIDIAAVLGNTIMLLPSISQGSGPFANQYSRWLVNEPISDSQYIVAVSFYCALVTSTCLELIGADGPIYVEGPFANNGAYLKMLAAATQRPVYTNLASTTGTSFGTAMLAGADSNASRNGNIVVPDSDFIAMLDYAAIWVGQTTK